MNRFRFVCLIVVSLAGCTYFTEVSRYDVCERCDGGSSRAADDLDDAGAAPDEGVHDADAEVSECVNGRDC